eukprot:2179616-Pyramimonas_sp.AAC.1
MAAHCKPRALSAAPSSSDAIWPPPRSRASRRGPGPPDYANIWQRLATAHAPGPAPAGEARARRMGAPPDAERDRRRLRAAQAQPRDASAL